MSKKAAISSKTRFCSFQSKKLPMLMTFWPLGFERLVSHTITSRSASG